ncbi:MAG: hypothetical protein V1658_04040 [Candidatus Micrarchaeota archaeon]
MEGKWKFKGITDPGITLGKVAKIFRYFEIARAMKSPLKFVLPTVEYSLIAEENAEKLGIDPKEVRKAVIKVGVQYQDIIERIQKRFFSEIKTEIVQTHEAEVDGQLEREISRPVVKKSIRETEGSYMGKVFTSTKAKRRSEARFIAIFSRELSQPSIWLLNGRDVDSVFPFSVKIGTRMGIDVRKNLGIIGVPGDPAIRDWGPKEQANFLIYRNRLAFGDDYFGRYPYQTANLNEPLKMNDLLRDDKGKLVLEHYIRALGPYVGLNEPKPGKEAWQFKTVFTRLQHQLGIRKLA